MRSEVGAPLVAHHEGRVRKWMTRKQCVAAAELQRLK
jgi:hypothetical protein